MVPDLAIGASVSRAPSAFGFFRVLRAVRESKLTPTERLVLLVVASHADNTTGEAWPGIARIATETGFTTRTVERTIVSLAKAGWLSWRSAASKWSTNVYVVSPLVTARAATGTPDTGSGEPPIADRPTPDTRSGNLRSSIHPTPECTEPSSAKTEQPAARVEKASNGHTHDSLDVRAKMAAALLAELGRHETLRPIATSKMAVRLADVTRSEGRTELAAKKALSDLAEHAGDAAAAGAPWSAAVLACRARSYVRHARESGPTTRPATSPQRPPRGPQEPSAPLPPLSVGLSGLRGVLASLSSVPSGVAVCG